MTEIEEEIVFYAKAGQIKFYTHINCAKLNLTDLQLTREQAAGIAWLTNTDDNTQLEFQVKIKGI